MKMNKLFSSIAASAMVLTALAPAAVANAATGHPTAVSGSGVGAYTDGNLPMATSAAENVQDGSATAQSDASVKVIDGFLVLQSVPDFGFGTSVAGQTVPLYDFSDIAKNDGNQNGQLQVIDSRQSTPGAKDGMGFNVTAKLDNFTSSEAKPQKGGNFALTFGRITEEKSGSAFNLITDKDARAEEGATTPTTVLNALDKHSYGNHTFYYKANSNDAKLSVPDNTSAGSWTSVITWTLNGKAV
ncbi:hypothetical protein DS831_04970 [Bombilactobacillus bombi]|uniref:WxL domain-containing protein n=1 Tax=Bombilactobacillus bombi TaxID=1303590 RepID=A0A417ZI59_9LACO|nr:WxL domain-containing protein [Bombilactobacillus bombi]RHW51377.1 hypothetical protein DS831_04970 [Bombilactobacillus bombi]